jgi:spore maturation protein CgeB
MYKFLILTGDTEPFNQNLSSSYVKGEKNYYYKKAIENQGHQCEVLNVSFLPFFFEVFYNKNNFNVGFSEKIKAAFRNFYKKRKQKKFENFVISLIRNHNDADFIIFSKKLFFINKGLLQSFREYTNACFILFNTVSPIMMENKNAVKCAKKFDYIFCNDYFHSIQWLELGAENVHQLPIAAAPLDFYKEYVNSKGKNKDVVFVGRLDKDIYKNRRESLKFLIKNGIDVKIYSNYTGIDSDPILSSQHMGDAWYGEMHQVTSESKIALNFHGYFMQSGGNMRLFEIPLSHSLQIADRCPEKWFTDNQEIVVTKTDETLLDKIKYYLNNEEERDIIAKNAYKKTIEEHTYENRVESMLKIIFEKK